VAGWIVDEVVAATDSFSATPGEPEHLEARVAPKEVSIQ
jgi:hypothetical protein